MENRAMPIALFPVARWMAVLLCVAWLAGCSDRVTAPPLTSRTPVLHPTRVELAGAEVNAALRWNQTSLEAVSNGALGPPMVARALAIVHTAMYDAWAPYDETAIGTRVGASLRRPSSEHTLANKSEAVSYAAYRALVDLFPAQIARFDARMAALGLDPANTTQDAPTPAGIGNLAAAALLSFRHQDGSNQLGTMGPTGQPYSDYTGYVPVNTPDAITDPNRWQPLRFTNRAGTATDSQVCPAP